MTLDELRRQMDALPPSPWYYGIAFGSQSVDATYSSPGYYDNPGVMSEDGTTVVGCSEYMVFDSNEAGLFIAAMRNALPDLIAAVEALRDLLCEMSEPVWDDPRIDYEEVQITKGEREKARAILKRLGVE